MDKSPMVTGISPKEGPPGTKVTIRGERLGKSQSDLVGLQICGVDCFMTAEWISPNKILARTLICKSKGDIIIKTKSGGVGSSTVQFRGYVETSVGPTKESAVWVDETVSSGLRPLSISVQQEDPLQISVEGNEKKYPVEELLEMFPESTGNLRSENFAPAWFLLENHHATGFEDLKSGLHFLNRKVSSQTEGKLSFLKENVSSVIDQLDALILLKNKFEKYHEQHGSAYVAQIDDAIGVSEREATKLFQDVLARKDRADVTRNALSGYQRFKFLFSLPGSLEKSIQNEEFDLAINDYARAKTLFEQPETDKPVFRKFRKEVAKKVQKLVETLQSKLTEKPPKLDEQKIMIEYLVALEVDFDCGWVCLLSHYESLSHSMKACFLQYSSNDRPREITRTSSKYDAQAPATYPSQVLFIDNLCEIFSTYFTDFWRLSQDYFASNLPVKPDLGKQKELKEMMISIVQLFANLVSSCLLPNKSQETDFVWNDRTTDSLSNWLHHCLSDIKETFTEFLALDPPKEMVSIIRNLIFDIRKSSLETMIHQMSEEIADLYKQESWTCEPCGPHGFITTLPSQYETLVTNSCKVIKKTLLQKSPEEIPLMKNEAVVSKLKEDMGNALSSFADALELLISQNRPQSTSTPSRLAEKSVSQALLQAGLPSSQSACVLLILNNCAYTRDVILPQLQKALGKFGYPDFIIPFDKTKKAIMSVENLAFTKYTEMKYEPVVGQIEQYMYSGNFDWQKCTDPKQVSTYISRTLVGMTEIIAEVSAISENLLATVMNQVVENVCEELTRLFSCIPRLSENGCLQATLDILAFQEIIKNYLSPESRKLIKETLSLIPKSNEIIRSSKKLPILLKNHRENTNLMYRCFGMIDTNNHV